MTQTPPPHPLANESRLLWHAIEQSANSIIIANVSGYIEYVNPQFTQLTGYTLEEVRGKNPRILKSGYTTPEEYTSLWESITSGQRWEGTFHNKKKSGELYWEHATISPVRDDEGNITHFVAIKEDITQRILAEQKLSATNARLGQLVEERTAQLNRLNKRMNAILNHVSNPIVFLDVDGTIDVANPAFTSKLGYEMEDLFGSPFWQLFPENDCAAIQKMFEDADFAINTTTYQAQIVAKNGAHYDTEISFVKVPNNDGHVVCTLYDISHLKEMERIKDEFVSMVSHELRTPISTVLLSAETMTRYYHRLSEDQRLQKVAQIVSQSQRLNQLVTGILDIARLDARHESHVKTTNNIAEILQEVVVELAGQAEVKQHTVTVDVFTKAPILLHSEPLDMVRVWRNLLTNAIKYTQDGGHITAQLYGALTDETVHKHALNLSLFEGQTPPDLASGHYHVGFVADNGHGIPEGDLPHLFTRFYRGWAGNTAITGTGLGLPLVRQVLRLYGGDVAVHSEVGVGTTICFWFPADCQDARTEGTAS